MNKIIFVVNNLQIENYILESIIRTLDLFPDDTIEVFVENKSSQDSFFKRLKQLKTIDIHFKSFKKNPFSLVDLKDFELSRLKIIEEKSNLSISDWVIFANNSDYDFFFYENLSKKGLIAFDNSFKELVYNVLNNKKQFSVNFKLKI